MKLFLHGLYHGLIGSSYIHEIWWVEIPSGKKMMCGERCVHCGKILDIKPTGIELEFEHP